MSNPRRRLLHVLALAAIAALVGVVATALSAEAAPAETTAAAAESPPLPRRSHVRLAPRPTLGKRIAKRALRAVGVPYRWGGASLAGFDCSGLVYWAHRRFGVEVPHSSYAIWSSGRSVARGRLQAGDVLVFSGLGHVGLYIGRGRMVHAPYSGRRVEIVDLAHSHYRSRLVGARRFS